MEIFMDDFTVYRSSFENCLHNLGTVLHRCQDKNLALNWEKMSFYGNIRHCPWAHDFYSRAGSRPSKGFNYKKSYATNNSQGNKKFLVTCWFLQKIYQRLL